jgi:hypothetical protein
MLTFSVANDIRERRHCGTRTKYRSAFCFLKSEIRRRSLVSGVLDRNFHSLIRPLLVQQNETWLRF